MNVETTFVEPDLEGRVEVVLGLASRDRNVVAVDLTTHEQNAGDLAGGTGLDRIRVDERLGTKAATDIARDDSQLLRRNAGGLSCRPFAAR